MARIKRNLYLLDAFFAEYKDLFEWVKPKAGTIAFPRLKGTQSSLDFCQKLVKETNIMLLPSTVYDYDDRHFRLGFGRENMPEALEKFREYLKSTRFD
jgi:aspartate/methionine/tyrosine aminotransferase